MTDEGDALIVIGLAVVLFGLSLILFYHPGQSQIQTANATTTMTVDYFSLSCAQLEAQVNTELNNPTVYYYDNGDRQVSTEAIALLQIMQLKGCAVP